jgi:nucleotide-binding universal stress UspA family protein
MYQHILLPTDGSEVAQRGIAAGLELAKAIGARVTFVVASEPLPAVVGGMAFAIDLSQYAGSQDESAKALLKTAKAAADQAGVVTAELVHASESQPAAAILETSKSRHCDLIVMASHGRRGMGRLLLGSQTAEVVTHSQIPVLVIK